MDGRFVMLSDEISRRTDLSATAKLLYAHLRRHEQGGIGVCVASDRQLAFEVGSSLRTVGRALDQLEDVGLISRTTRGKARTIITQEWEY